MPYIVNHKQTDFDKHTTESVIFLLQAPGVISWRVLILQNFILRESRAYQSGPLLLKQAREALTHIR